LILLMVVRDIGEMASILYLRKKRSSILSGWSPTDIGAIAHELNCQWSHIKLFQGLRPTGREPFHNHSALAGRAQGVTVFYWMNRLRRPTWAEAGPRLEILPGWPCRLTS
jgi:hypothetical protein